MTGDDILDHLYDNWCQLCQAEHQPCELNEHGYDIGTPDQQENDGLLTVAEADALANHLRTHHPTRTHNETHTLQSHTRRETTLGRPLTTARHDGEHPKTTKQ